MSDQDVRDFLRRMSIEEPTPLSDAEPLIRRAHRRAARTVVIGALGAAAAVAVLFAGASQLRGAPPNVPATTPVPADTSGMARDNGEVLSFTGVIAHDDVPGSPGELVAVDPRTGEERVLLEDLDSVYSARWSADGRWLAYETDATDGSGVELWVTGASQAPRVVATGGAYIGGDPLAELRWEWSPTGAVLAMIENSETLRTLDVTTGEATDLGTVVADLMQRFGPRPWAWSPDRTHFVFASPWGTREGSLYSVDARSGERSLLARLPYSIEAIRQSPDGVHIAVQTRGKDDVGHLYLMDADGSDVRLVTDDSNSLGFAWSPDGTRLAFGSAAARVIRIRVATTDGAAPVEIGAVGANNCYKSSWGSGYECSVTWSPDGTTVAFRKEETGTVTAFGAAGAGEAGPLDELTFLSWDGGWYRPPAVT